MKDVVTKKMQQFKLGFSLVKGVLLIVLIAIISFVAWYVLHTQMTIDKTLKPLSTSTPSFKKTVKAKTSPSPTPIAKSVTPTPTTPATNNPYAGWKTATLQYEKLSFQYPANWTLANSSYATGSTNPINASCVTPGADTATLALPDGESMLFNTGLICGARIGNQVASVPITTLGANYYISIVDDDSSASDNGQPTKACLSTVGYTLVGHLSKNIFTAPGHSGNPANYFCLNVSSVGATTPAHQATATMQNSSDFATAKLVVESLKY